MSEVYEFIKGEVERSEMDLSDGYRQVFIVGCSDDGEIAVFPCKAITPFHYPRNIEELESYDEQQHFDIDETHWDERWLVVQEFQKQYEFACLPENEESFDTLLNNEFESRVSILKEACLKLRSQKPIVFVKSESEYWFEVNTIHLAGPELPRQFEKRNDIEVFSMLLRHVNSRPEYSLKIEGGVVVEVDLSGGSTDDSTINILRNIPSIETVLQHVRRINMDMTRVSQHSLDFLKNRLQNAEVNYTH
ncbi:hypothetical protein [Pleionea sp. CnH1-48]|uniref:hypothetical protein n=1 Tax=Pleionea sp. CnH1-48 TaxID=2954494 RepID=UPI0020979978|nr:hypothetical protein [Pleionea sp. CnH1-48]MCO7223557.1 hypothetical protein [Pleionea sp. CnH1-48]